MAAGGGEHHGAEVIPWSTIAAQAFNFFLLVAILAWVSRKAVSQMFTERKKTYLDLVQRADAAKNEAEKNRREIAGRLQKLEDTAQESLVQAKSQAQEMQQRIMAEARELANKAKEEAERAARFELERAKQELREEVLGSAVEAARKALQDKVSGAEQKKLQSEFVEKIQVVR
ncbi:MAG: ATP synthase F0 subunit B [Bdellovibrionales bacterium]